MKHIEDAESRSRKSEAFGSSTELHTQSFLAIEGLSRSAIIIGFVSLLSDISSEMIYPILPLFLTETLHAPATVLGLVEGIAVGASTAIGGFSGWISDRLGRRKPVAFFGYALTAVTRPLIAAAHLALNEQWTPAAQSSVHWSP